MANLIVEAIKGKCKVEYSGEDNPLNTQYLRTSQMKSVVSLIGDLAMNGDLDCNAEGVEVICRMVSEELGDIVKQLDRINFEICKAIPENGKGAEANGSKEVSGARGRSVN